MRAYVAVVVAALAATAWAQQVPKAPEAPKLGFAVIDVNVLVQDSAAGKEAMGRLKKAQDEKIAQRKKLADEAEALQKQLEAQRVTLADSKVQDLQKQIEDKGIALKRFDDDAQQQLQELQKKELDGLEKQIMPIIQEVGREMKLQMIFNKFQSGLVYADEATDITDLVLRRFNTRVTK
ncbi:MAG TPA: OmpH family outer membrane protein [Thermoanaerobaculaceae bacterium]|jgi:outer membrane protein|nr:OmpH family outer membrane protein [Thermoanaerobaculaceae bacterium]